MKRNLMFLPILIQLAFVDDSDVRFLFRIIRKTADCGASDGEIGNTS